MLKTDTADSVMAPPKPKIVWKREEASTETTVALLPGAGGLGGVGAQGRGA